MSAPLWRRAYDVADRAVTPRLEELVRTSGFAQGTAFLRWAEAIGRSAARDVSARAWHLLNLPAGSDVQRLRAQIGQLDREVRRLIVRAENSAAGNRRASIATPEELPNGPRSKSAGGSGPRPARRRAQRPPGP
jgi:hypothetical protein